MPGIRHETVALDPDGPDGDIVVRPVVEARAASGAEDVAYQ